MREIAGTFGISDITDIIPFGSGHINDTFLVSAGGERYILQSLNTSVFSAPEMVMKNAAITEAASLRSGAVKVPHYISVGGKNYIKTDSRIWRMYRYAESCAVSAEEGSRMTGYAFGSFTAMISGCKYSTVSEDIHDYQRYLAKLTGLIGNSSSHRSELAVLTDTWKILSNIFNSSLPHRNVHNDAKSDNVIFGGPCTVIDLDTVGKGYAALDYGDMVRSVCKSESDIPLLVPLTEGYAQGLGGILTAGEVRSLATGIFYVTAELAMRYLIDALSGEGYFHRSADECLSRANGLMSQLELFSQTRRFINKTIEKAFGM